MDADHQADDRRYARRLQQPHRRTHRSPQQYPDPNNIQTNDWFFAIPDGWLTEEGTMSAEHLEHIFRWMYGPQWRSGNADGSKYIVVRHTIGRVDPAVWRAAGQRQRLDVSGNVTRLK